MTTVNTQQAVWLFVFLVWHHHLQKANKSSGVYFQMLFSKIFLFLMFPNIQIDLNMLKTEDKQFTFTTKKITGCHL